MYVGYKAGEEKQIGTLTYYKILGANILTGTLSMHLNVNTIDL